MAPREAPPMEVSEDEESENVSSCINILNDNSLFTYVVRVLRAP